MKNIVYHVNYEKKVVVAVVKCNPKQAYEMFVSTICKNNTKGMGLIFYENDQIFGKMKLKSEYVGIARCAPSDVFNVEYGKKLARLRAEKKKSIALASAYASYTEWISGICKNALKVAHTLCRKAIDSSVEVDACLNKVGEID